MKKIINLTLVLCMVIGLFLPIIPYAETKYTIKIGGTEQDEYELYQVFTGKYSPETKGLSNIDWGNGITKAGQGALGDATTLAKNLKTEKDTADFAKKVAQYLDVANRVKTSGKTEIEVGPGYYLIKGITYKNGEENNTSYILTVAGDVEVEPKSDLPTMNLKVKERNESTGYESDWQDAADYEYGKSIDFKLTGTVSSQYEFYLSYYYNFICTLDMGLDPNYGHKATVWVVDEEGNEEEVTEYFQEIISGMEDGTTVLSFVANLKEIPQVNSDSKIVVKYTATLNEYAEMGSKGNKNVAVLEFNDDPYFEGRDVTYAEPAVPGTTKEDVNYIYSYQLEVNKLNEELQSLEGAGFTLYKYYDNSGYKQIGDEYRGPSTFIFEGLDAGKYKLVETTVPEDYEQADEIEFTIAASYSTDSEAPTLDSLSFTENNDYDAIVSLDTGNIRIDVVNIPIITLPRAGSIGIISLIIIGVALMAGSGFLIYRNKKKISK